MSEEVTTTTTTTESERDRNIYRFEGFRYQLQGPNKWGPNEVIPEEPGLMTYPKSDGD
jgi:hypothetical protein